MTSIEQLEQQLRNARESARVEGNAAFEALSIQYEWKITWHSERRFTCAVKPTQQSVDQINALKAMYPMSAHRAPSIDFNSGSMEYVLIGNALVAVSGGLCVLDMRTDHSKDMFSHEPRDLTDEQASELRAGRVPNQLKAIGTSK